MTLTFDPSVEYRDESVHVDWIEDATWERPSDPGYAKTTGFKVKRSDLDTPEMQQLTSGYSLTSSSAGFTIWQPTDMNPTFDPRPGDRLRIGNDGWVLRKVTASRFGFWTALCEVEK